MLFNSIEFAVFLPIVFLLYWFVFNRKVKIQNLLIVIASFIFYGWWDWRFLLLMVFSASVDFISGIQIEKTKKKNIKRAWLLLSITGNIGILFFFKYFNFFTQSFIDLLSVFSIKVDPVTIKVILPVGISFYTFQALSYTIDIYKGKFNATHDVVAYFAFISFFPQLVAGPIERATNLLPQFYKPRQFDHYTAVVGMRQILWGLFKKMVIADNCAVYANQIFENYSHYSGSTLLLGIFFFTIQIYGDFSGYSDIAIGTARLFGFSLMQNFAYPYFSRDIAEFWRRWHISLSTWFRDYLYYPLGGSKVNRINTIKNIFILFMVSGFWHGANWTFMAWGFLNACYFLPLLILNKNRKNLTIVAHDRNFLTIKEFFQILITFLLTLFAWIFFRSETLTDAFKFIDHLFSQSFFSEPAFKPYYLFVLIFILFYIEWLARNQKFGLEICAQIQNKGLRWLIYIVLILIILILQGAQQEFIYFQF